MTHRSEKASHHRQLGMSCRLALLAVSILFAASLLAQGGPASSVPAEKTEGHDAASSQLHARPNYELASRFMPAKISKLVFDTSVTPHWFELSDRFWYSYETTEGRMYYIVDPVKRAKAPLWDNARIAATLSTLTNFPYDAQHLPIRNLKLVEKDTKMRFEVEVRKNAVIPNEVKKEETKEEETNQENIENQQQQRGQRGQGQRGQQAGAAGEAPAENRTIYFEYELATGKLTRLDKYEAPPKKAIWAAISPDEKVILFARGQNLYMMDAENYKKAQKKTDDASIVETQLTTDGVEKYSYARVLLPEDQETLKKDNKGDANNKAGMRTQSITIHWSKDSKKFALIREDNRKVADLWVIHTLSNPRPILESYSYALPGEDNVPISDLQIWDVDSKQHVTVQVKDFFDPMVSISDSPITNKEREQNVGVGGGGMGGFGPTRSPRWLSETSDKLYFTSMARNFRSVDVLVADTSTGAVKTLIQERSNVWLDVRPLRIVNNGQELLWWSQRDGWAHYYLYDGEGKLKNQITSGEWMADQIVSIDEKARVLYFTGNGREAGEDPYYDHLYRANLDGTGLKLLSPGNFSHSFAAPDSGKYFTDTFSRVDTAPKSVLLDTQGTVVAELETADVRRLLEAGFKYPEMFHVKADDGITDLYGVIYKPFDFDPSRKYPLIEYVYPGPQTESVTKTFPASSSGTAPSQNIALAQLGFIVIEVGARGGSPDRDKWYDSYGYGNLRDYGLADKKAAAEQLAAIHPYIDINRVGMWGHSGGGFMTAAAMLQYPDFFKAGWSESGNHDNNVYNKTWSEKYHGVREEVQKDGTSKFIYNIDQNSQIAKNLTGHLMLTTGDMDNNVHAANTMRLADALIKANKRFEMLVFPGIRHGYMPISDYVVWRRMDFFAQWLLGASESQADIMELQREKQATPSRKFPE
jgi:dipeptidyl aminopeptidase/acylaminoacyl peptidase